MPDAAPPTRPNILFILTDQLRATSLPAYGEHQIATPHLDRLASEGTTLDNMISGCPVCTPTRAMLLTGRHPQTTGHLMNSVRTRHSELSVADAFGRAGYRTGWVGKWHLHSGHWPAVDLQPMQPDWVPEGRDRLGFDYWRAYNQHMVYFDGFVQGDDWSYERWNGYEPEGLWDYGRRFIDTADDRPFCLFLSPHQPHYTPGTFAPEEYYHRLPAVLTLPPNVPPALQDEALVMYRHYLAMILALDDMVGAILDHLDRAGLAENTLVIFTADHGTQGGSQGIGPWAKQQPYDASIRVPMILRWPGHLRAGAREAAVMSMVDIFPTLCGLTGVPVPRSVEGIDLSSAMRGAGGRRRTAAYLMNFTAAFDWLATGNEWRGLRTESVTYVRRLDGRTELFDLAADPHQMTNVAGAPEWATREAALATALDREMARRGDALVPITDCKSWFDTQRRVIRNSYGPLGPPEALPDWSLLTAAS